jgi:hypothetical protein
MHFKEREMTVQSNTEQVASGLRSPTVGKRVSHSYYVVMVDYGKRGLEAIVHPEDTRRAIVEQLATGESKHVVFIHHVDGLFVEDVTDELFNEAEAICRLQAAE